MKGIQWDIPAADTRASLEDTPSEGQVQTIDNTLIMSLIVLGIVKPSGNQTLTSAALGTLIRMVVEPNKVAIVWLGRMEGKEAVQLQHQYLTDTHHFLIFLRYSSTAAAARVNQKRVSSTASDTMTGRGMGREKMRVEAVASLLHRTH